MQVKRAGVTLIDRPAPQAHRVEINERLDVECRRPEGIGETQPRIERACVGVRGCCAGGGNAVTAGVVAGEAAAHTAGYQPVVADVW
jgi:hypothetical protein